MKIIIYGLGSGLEYIERNLREDNEIVGYSDSYADIGVFNCQPFYKPDKLKDVEYDFLILAIRNRKEAWRVYELLTGNRYGLDEKKVIPFYSYASAEYWDECLAHAPYQKIEGLIFGTSYARLGILPEYLSRTFINLGVPSQDLYGDLMTFRACISKYPEKLRELKYIILDMFDYNYFNFDTSLCKLFFTHLEFGGIQEEHNFAQNSNYGGNFIIELEARLGIRRDEKKKELLSKLFYESYAIDKPLDAKNRFKGIDRSADFPAGFFEARVIKIYDENTVGQNKRNLEQLLDEIWKWNPDIKVVMVLFPKYITLEETSKTFMETWKNDFLRILEDFTKRKNLYFWNYKFCKGIADNGRFWADVSHLNTMGARCMSSIIEEDLKREIY